MTATFLDILMILSLGILAGTGAGLCIGFVAQKQKRNWAAMQKTEIRTTVLLILACSSATIAVLAWYVLYVVT